jgi:hypothetical protein
MNVLTTTWRQLVRSRLLPVAVLLVAALAAVPFVLAKDPAPVVPEAPVTTAPSEPTKSEDSLAEPVVAKISSEDRSRRRRVLGVRKDPFEPAPLPKPKKKKTATKTVKKHTDTPPTVSSPPVTSSPIPTIPPVDTTPAPVKKTYAKDSLIVRFGDASGTATRMNVKKLAPLPDDDDPLLVYMGLTKNGKQAIFLVDESLDATGDGTCKPHPASCETIQLGKGETEFFDVLDPETGEITAQYELDLIDIK